jgi:hypothetical protein
LTNTSARIHTASHTIRCRRLTEEGWCGENDRYEKERNTSVPPGRSAYILDKQYQLSGYP